MNTAAAMPMTATDMDSQPVAGVFAFEGYMERTLEYIPISVHMKLRLCGIKLSLAQWCGLPIAVRQTLLDTDCGVSNAILRVRLYLEFTLNALRLGPLLSIGCDPRTWSARTRVPVALRTAIKRLGLRCPAQYAWSALDDLQRFALVNLARPGSVRKLHAALAEFGLLSQGGGQARHREPARAVDRQRGRNTSSHPKFASPSQ
jgi:hypothetical protein